MGEEDEEPMTLAISIVCIATFSLIALWQAWRAAIWHKAGVDVVVNLKLALEHEKLKRTYILDAIVDLKRALVRTDARGCAQAVLTVEKLARDDSNATLRELGADVIEQAG